MTKKILVFSNGEKIGDGIIKLQLLHEIKTRLPDYKLYWLTNKGCLLYTSPSPRDLARSRMPSSA